MTWHPQVLRDPALSGSEACWAIGCDPGRPTGLAILHCSAEGTVHAASATLRFGKHSTPSGDVITEVGHALITGMTGACLWLPWSGAPGPDPRGEWWEYAGEDMGAVHVRAGTDHAQAQGKRLSLQRVARLEGQIAEAVSQAVALRGEAVYESRQWRKLLDAASESSHTAKGLAMWFCHRHFGADWRAPEGTGDEQSVVWTMEHFSHEAEAVCIGLWHIRQVRQGERRAQSPLPDLAPGRGKRAKRDLSIGEHIAPFLSPEGREAIAEEALRRAGTPLAAPTTTSAPERAPGVLTAAHGALAQEACGNCGHPTCRVVGTEAAGCNHWVSKGAG